jgi:hypothetical protein
MRLRNTLFQHCSKKTGHTQYGQKFLLNQGWQTRVAHSIPNICHTSPQKQEMYLQVQFLAGNLFDLCFGVLPEYRAWGSLGPVFRLLAAVNNSGKIDA